MLYNDLIEMLSLNVLNLVILKFMNNKNVMNDLNNDIKGFFKIAI